MMKGRASQHDQNYVSPRGFQNEEEEGGASLDFNAPSGNIWKPNKTKEQEKPPEV